MKIAVIEDSPQLSYQISSILKENRYIVRSFKDGKSAIKSVPVDEFDLCVVDVNLPDMNGYEVCKKLRQSKLDLLILFLTVRDSIQDKIRGFEAGGDDYLTKPFEVPELIARIKALLKRKVKRAPVLDEVGGLTIHHDNQAIMYDGKQIDLSVKEFNILEYLLHHQGMIVSRDTIADLVWENPLDMSENIVAVYIGKIRKKLKESTGKQFIKTIKGKGYIIEE